VSEHRLSVRLVPGSDVDADELAELTRDLRTEILELDVVAADPVLQDGVPADAKGAAEVLGLLSVILGTGLQLAELVSMLRGWGDRTQRTVEVSIDGDTLKLGDATADQQERIVAQWLARHSPDT
jgi:hypothetical protein